MTIGEKILNLRKARGWSQEELAEHIGVTRQAVSRWESGAAKPDTDKVIAICDLFGVSADYLIRDYAGGSSEPVQTAAPKQATAIGEAIRAMTLRQWLLLGAFVLGALMLLILRFIYVFQDTNYSYYGSYFEYHGYKAFILNEELSFLHYGAWVCVLLGPIIWLPRWLWRKMAVFFNWNG